MISECFFVFLLAVTGCLPHTLSGQGYKEVLRLSLLFYEAQRSGRLPENNRIKWRGDSCLQDKGQKGEDLTGGYYDASDFVKFGFTMVFATTVLSWGVLSYEEAYRRAGQYGEALDAIRWATDFIIKCHVGPFEFYGQVGDFQIDHKFWGRPEELNTTRTAYKIDKNHPGSDLAGEAAAALAAASLVFRREVYSKTLIKHAQELYEFAVKYRGLYHEVIPGGKIYFQSSGYEDEVAWAAMWLYKATGGRKYFNETLTFYKEYNLDKKVTSFFYNEKRAGIQILLAQAGVPDAVEVARSFCDDAIFKQRRTPNGLVYIDKTGTLAHASNIAFLCLQLSNANISKDTYINFADEQAKYILGSSGQSYLVGYGKKYPQRPHHAASSCPDVPAPCGWDQYKSNASNPQVLYGALVSGPDPNDYYEDRRDEYLFNDVTVDYNAGFQGVIAGLIHYQNQKIK